MSPRSEVNSCTSQFGKLPPSPAILGLTLSSLTPTYSDFFFPDWALLCCHQLPALCWGMLVQCAIRILLGTCSYNPQSSLYGRCLSDTDANNDWASWSSWSVFLSCTSWICVCLDFSFCFDINIQIFRAKCVDNLLLFVFLVCLLGLALSSLESPFFPLLFLSVIVISLLHFRSPWKHRQPPRNTRNCK